MTVTTPSRTGYRAAFDAFTTNGAGGAPEWVQQIREASIDAFERVGFPTLKHEEWRFTDLSRLTETSFALGSGDASKLRSVLSYEALRDLPGPRLVFVDGHFVPEHSRVGDLPPGVTVDNLAHAMTKHRELVEPHLDRLTAAEDDGPTALNSAFLRDGAFVHVASGAQATEPIHAIFVSTAPAEPSMTHPRALFVVGDGGHATLVEDFVSAGSGFAFTNPLTEIVVGAKANVRHYRVQRENDASYWIATTFIDQGEGSDFASHSALLGGAVVRNNVYPVLSGSHCLSVLNGMYVPRGEQLHDSRMRVRHSYPHGESRQYYRGILDDRAKAMFSGRIIVDQDAQKTDAVQSNKNLLLSEHALVETKPQLEIYADDVKCTHGATIGQLDEEAIFYFLARGIDRPTARRLLVFAFVNEIFERMELAPVREQLQALVSRRLSE